VAYRDQFVDPRVAELQALIASEPALRTKLVPLRLEQDDLQGQSAVLGAQLSEAEATLAKRRQGGVLAALGGWFGRSLEEHEASVAGLSAEYQQQTARLDQLVADERALLADIAKAVAATAELEALRERAVEALRVSEGPQGDEMRAIEAEDTRDRAQRAEITRMLDVIDIARTSVWQIQTVLGDLRQLTGSGATASVVMELLESPFSTPATHEQRDDCRERLKAAFEFAVIRLNDVVALYDRTGCTWFGTMPPDRIVQLAARRHLRTEDTDLVRNAEAVITCMFQLARELGEVRDRLLRDELSRKARRDELLDRMV